MTRSSRWGPILVHGPTSALERPKSWGDVLCPLLVVEILSGGTRHRDVGAKRAFYMDAGIPDYWIVDGDTRRIVSSGPHRPDLVAGEILTWRAVSATRPLTIDIREYFRAAIG